MNVKEFYIETLLKFLRTCISSLLSSFRHARVHFGFCEYIKELFTIVGCIWVFLLMAKCAAKAKEFIYAYLVGTADENRDKIVEEICNYIYRNNTIECIQLVESHLWYINEIHRGTGYSPFLVACQTGNTQLVNYMLQRGADVTKKSLGNETAFYLAASYLVLHPSVENASCIRALYYAGADINEANGMGYTPLQMAAMFGHSKLVKWLLYKKASLNVTPHPYLIARSQGHDKTAVEINNAGRSIEYI